jgi:hypothetical protein
MDPRPERATQWHVAAIKEQPYGVVIELLEPKLKSP